MTFTLAAMTVGDKMVGLMLVVDCRVGQRGIICNPVRVHLLPQRMLLLQYITVHLILVKATLQPTLHKVTAKMREWEARPGMMWACQAKVGRAKMLSVHMCWSVCAHHLVDGQWWVFWLGACWS
jgi:hypothetical protein